MKERSYRDKEMDKVKQFAKDCPKGFAKLKEYIGNLKEGRVYSSKEYAAMFEALMEQDSIADAWKAGKEKGLDCRTKQPFEKVVSAAGRYVARYEVYHPYVVSVRLPQSVQDELMKKFNAVLAEYGFETANAREFQYVDVKKIDGERFDSNEVVFIQEDGTVDFPDEKGDSEMYSLGRF